MLSGDINRIFSRPSRMQPCPCGSGERYKDCHGTLSSTAAQTLLGPPPTEILDIFSRKALRQEAFRSQHGQVKTISLTIAADGTRFLLLGSKCFKISDRNWNFHDLLSHLIQARFNVFWGSAQLAVAKSEQHPVVGWYCAIRDRLHSKAQDEKNGPHSAWGAWELWLRLGYDMYLLEHHNNFPKTLLKRLRDPLGFQGARFELFAAAVMIVGGYRLAFVNHRAPGKHPEFIATDTTSGQKIAVEAKSRHRDGILGRPGNQDHDRILDGVFRNAKNAAEKDPRDPLLIFIELNLHLMADHSNQVPLRNELEQIWEKVQALPWPNGFPAIGIVFHNDPAPWYVDEPPPEKPTFFAYLMAAKTHRHEFDERPFLVSIRECIRLRSNVPEEFPVRL